MSKRLLLAIALLLGGCTTSPPVADNALTQIRAGLPQGETVKYTGVAIWLPNSKEFLFRSVEPYVRGVAVITDQNFLFQTWGGPTGTTVQKKIAFRDIRKASLLSFGRSSRVVLESNNGTFDSFAVSDGNGTLSLGAPTAAMYIALLQAAPDALRSTWQ